MTDYQLYLESLRQPFQKLVRLRFLNPDGSSAFVLDNDPLNARAGAFLSSGELHCNLQNGQRRTASVTLSNVDQQFDYSINSLWFGQEVALDEGVLLPNGQEIYFQQGIFLLDTPRDELRPDERTITYNLVDKWAGLDGTLYGNLEGTYEVAEGTNIFRPITALLSEDKGNGQLVDNMTPVYTDYYNSMTQEMPDGTSVAMTDTPYTLRIDSESGTIAEVILGLTGMLNAWVGYDNTGALRVDPSQDDLLDTAKPVAWQFQLEDFSFLGATYTIKNTEVYNDYIVVGEQLDDYTQPYGRATNTNPQSDTNVQTIGRKTIRENRAGFATNKQCQDLADWMLKRSSILQKAVSISCSQILHISENELVEIVRTDKPNSPVERHLIMGFSRPLNGTEQMTIDAVSVNDLIL
jgi:hypothetical protein